MKYHLVPTKQFKKDVRRLERSRMDLQKLEKTIDLLKEGKTLGPEYRDHELKGKLSGTRECHIAPDWLLMYTKDHDKLILLLLRTGTHRDVLGIE